MQLTHLLAAALAATASAANFKLFKDTSCQRWDGQYVPLTAAQLEQYVVQNFPGEPDAPQASRFFGISEREKCPSNSNDTYRWVPIPPWQAGNDGNGRNGGGMIAVVYYKETDTYNACIYLASSQFGSYVGSCK